MGALKKWVGLATPALASTLTPHVSGRELSRCVPPQIPSIPYSPISRPIPALLRDDTLDVGRFLVTVIRPLLRPDRRFLRNSKITCPTRPRRRDEAGGADRQCRPSARRTESRHEDVACERKSRLCSDRVRSVSSCACPSGRSVLCTMCVYIYTYIIYIHLRGDA